MPFFPSLPDDAGVRHILSFNPAAGRALVEFHTAPLRNASALAPADKDLIAPAGRRCAAKATRRCCSTCADHH